MKTKKAKVCLYQQITNEIIKELEQGTCRWVKPWSNEGAPFQLPRSGTSGNTYRGVNVLNLMQVSEFTQNPVFITYKQAQEAGGNVIKGQRAFKCVFFKSLEVEDKQNEGEKKQIPMIKQFNVFNVEQCENLDLNKIKNAEPVERPEKPDSVAIDLAEQHGVKYFIGADRAANWDALNAITLPPKDTFKDADHFASTVFHELIHWTGSSIRLNRTKGYIKGNKEQQRAYAFEELVAELGAAFMCAHYGIANEQLQHAEYLQSWLSHLKDDKKAIHKAASLAQKACDYLLAEREQEQAAA